MDIESIVLKNVSYLHARDPSILAWNRHGLDNIRINLAKELLNDTNKNGQMEDTQDHIQVFLRIKDGVPFNNLYKIDNDNLICNVPEGSRALRNIKKGDSMKKTYSFTKIFNPNTTQIEIFDFIVKPKILGFINGKNSTLMTYGASGSGKTFTIVGTPEEPGLIPRALEYVFRTIPKLKETPKVIPLANGEIKRLDEHLINLDKMQKSIILNATHIDRSIHIKTYKQMQQRLSSEAMAEINDVSDISVSTWVSFAEIYNENIYDLLKSPPLSGHQRPKLKLGHSKDCCYIKDLTTVNVTSGLEAYQVLQYGLHHLNYAATSVNSHSSRSHCIFTIKLVQSSDIEDGVYVSTFNFCDLAGSERVKKTMNVGKRLQESNNINTSLLVLGRCISTIRTAQQLKDQRLVPFRESKLTQLFQRALAGLEDIMMIVNMNPCRSMFDESQHVLNFSAVAKEILIEEAPKIVKAKKPNRFSRYMERKSHSTVNVEDVDDIDERDIEISKLKDVISELYLEIEQKRLDYRQELAEEREFIRSEYKECIEEMKKNFEERKARAINRIKMEYEEQIQILRNKLLMSDIISIDSSSDDEGENPRENDYISQIDSQKKTILELEGTIIDQQNKNKLIERELYEVREDKEKLRKEILQVKDQLRVQREGEYELKITLEEAEKAYSELTTESNELKTKYKKLLSEKLKLDEKVEQLEELVAQMNNNSDECDIDN